MARLAPLPVGSVPELNDIFEKIKASGHYIPNSQLILQRKPKIVRALRALNAAVFDPEGEVSIGFKRLLAYVASRTAGCQYCMAHNAGGSLKSGVKDEKLAAVWEFRSSPLFDEKERVALEFAIAAAAQPNDVSDELFEKMKRYWGEGQIVEIAALIAYFGFMNRFNDTMATPLEDEPIEVAEKHIAKHGWKIGKHRA